MVFGRHPKYSFFYHLIILVVFMDIIKGKTWTFGENIDTDVIIPGRYLRTFNPQDLADHVLEGERPDFTKNVKTTSLVENKRLQLEIQKL